MQLKNILRAPLLAAALCLSTLTLHTVAFAQAASAPDASAAPAPAATPAPAAPVATPMVTKETIDNPYGLEALWKQGDVVARGTLIIMVIMSMGSWYIIFTKLFEQANATAVIQYEEGVAVGYITDAPDQRLRYLAFVPGLREPEWWPAHKDRMPLSEVNPVVLSEALGDLNVVMAKAK